MGPDVGLGTPIITAAHTFYEATDSADGMRGGGDLQFPSENVVILVGLSSAPDREPTRWKLKAEIVCSPWAAPGQVGHMKRWGRENHENGHGRHGQGDAQQHQQHQQHQQDQQHQDSWRAYGGGGETPFDAGHWQGDAATSGSTSYEPQAYRHDPEAAPDVCILRITGIVDTVASPEPDNMPGLTEAWRNIYMPQLRDEDDVVHVEQLHFLRKQNGFFSFERVAPELFKRRSFVLTGESVPLLEQCTVGGYDLLPQVLLVYNIQFNVPL